VLRPGGRLILVGPTFAIWRGSTGLLRTIRGPSKPLQRRCEALQLQRFELEHVEPKFLPYTVKGSRLRSGGLVESLPRLRPLSSAFLGKQSIVLARKTAEGSGTETLSSSVPGTSQGNPRDALLNHLHRKGSRGNPGLYERGTETTRRHLPASILGIKTISRVR